MMNNKLINELAMVAQTNERSFTELFQIIEPKFKAILGSYLAQNNLTGFNFDEADYISMAGQAFWEALAGYESTKGDFLPRVAVFAKRRMKEVTDFNLASKRFDKSKQVISYDQLFESEEFDLKAEEDEVTYTERLVNDFIKTDKEGKVVEILMTTSDTKLRNEALTRFFGKYEATERKKVQRCRQRLQAHLTSNGVFI